jgi:hypothetical protein
MRNSILVAVVAIAMLLGRQADAWAQAEIGGSIGGLGINSTAGGSIVLADARVTARISERFAVEGLLDVMPDRDTTSTRGLYAIQVRQRIVHASSATQEIFVTYGGASTYNHFPRTVYQYTSSDHSQVEYVSPARTNFYPAVPILPMIGVGVHHVVNPHLALRLDAQAIVVPYPVLVTRLTGGVSVPLGRYSTHSTAR